MSAGPVIALVDGEHHPEAVRHALDDLAAEREVAAVLFCGGEEKLAGGVLEDPEAHYGRPVTPAADPRAALRRLAAESGAHAVVDLGDEPVLAPPERMGVAAVALHLGLRYEAPGIVLDPPRYSDVDFSGPKLAVIGTGKRTGKTAVATHWAALLRAAGARPAIVAMGRGGPSEPEVAEPGTGLERLLEISAAGRHAASDYLEDAALAGVPAVGARRVGGGLAGQPAHSCVPAAAAAAAALDPGALVFEGSGACVPPVEVDRTVCVVGDRAGALDYLGPYRLLRSDLALVMATEPGLREAVEEICPGRAVAVSLRPEPAEPLPEGARVAFFSTGGGEVAGLEPRVVSRNLARRGQLEADLERAASERCDVYLTELKAAAIDAVADRARREGARVVFVRNRPLGVDEDLDRLLMDLVPAARAVERSPSAGEARAP